MDVKGKVLLQLFSKSKFRNGTKTFLEPKILSLVEFTKLGFSAPLNLFTSKVSVRGSTKCCVIFTSHCVTAQVHNSL